MLAAQALFMYGYRDSARGRADTRPLADLIASRYPDAPVYSLHPQHRRSRPDTSIYLNRTIRIVRDSAQIVPIDRPQVLLVFQRKRTPALQLPEHWLYIDKAARGEDFWHAWALPPSP
jgi:hypothetical protein